MASMLIAAVGVALGSVRAAIEQRVLAVVGTCMKVPALDAAQPSKQPDAEE
jgi:hypothetical protein